MIRTSTEYVEAYVCILRSATGFMEVVDVTSPRRDLYGSVSKVQDHESVTIVSKDGNAVLTSEEDWDSIMETLHVMGDPDFMKNLEEARNISLSEREVWNRLVSQSF